MMDHLFDYQKNFLRHSANRKFFLGGRQSGKTETLYTYGVEQASEHGKMVDFVAPTHRMTMEAAKRASEFTSELKRSGKLPCSGVKQYKNELKFKNGGKLKFCVFDKTYNITHPDVVLIDEAFGIGDDEKEELKRYLNSHQSEVIASGTPEWDVSSVEFYTDMQFEVLIAPTSANPLVDKSLLSAEKDNMDKDKFQRRYLTGPRIGGHMIWDYEVDGTRIYDCPSCDFEEHIPLENYGQAIGHMEGWVYGKALQQPCQ